MLWSTAVFDGKIAARLYPAENALYQLLVVRLLPFPEGVAALLFKKPLAEPGSFQNIRLNS